MALIVTPGATDANSYPTVAEADAYMNTRLHVSDWPLPFVVLGVLTNEDGTATITAKTYGIAYTVVVVLGAGNNLPLTAALAGTTLTITLGTGAGGAADNTKNTALLVAMLVGTLPEFDTAVSGSGSGVIPVTASTAFDNSTAIKESALMMATRAIDEFFSRGVTMPGKLFGLPWAKVLLLWTGAPSDPDQALCWPRTGMFTRNGAAIASNVIPTSLKNATSEFARQLIVTDRTADNDVIVQGVTSLRAGPVSLTFKEDLQFTMIPEAVSYQLVPSWFVTRATSPSVMRVLGN
jgi:hypothetical protein